MADMHSHILPGVDDGARTLDDALKLLRMAVKDGVKSQILTPHIHLRRYKNTRQSLEKQFREFCEIVEQANIPIELHLSAEVRICYEIMQMGVDYFPRTRGESTLSSPGVIMTILREMWTLRGDLEGIERVR